MMTTYVLVHGAWYGGWCWREVAETLRSAGHEVFTPTLTGLGERVDEFTAAIGLRTHVDDVVDLLRQEQLRDVVLVGHSYAGLVVREAADREPTRVARITLVDAWAGRDGESLESLAPDAFRNWVHSATSEGAIAVPSAAAVGVTDPRVAAELEPRLTPQPQRTFSEATSLTGAVEAIPCRAVVCTPPGPVPFAEFAAGFGWATAGIEAGHDVMTTAPAALAKVLLEDA
jgi:pimeloyl-ACP methyl ester carboxylesterase